MENQKRNATREEVLKANIAVHSAISNEYNQDSHWRPENLKKVRHRIETICGKLKSGNLRLLDIGCGTGFIINLSADLFERIDGVDITEAMLEKVNTKQGNIHLQKREAEDTGFADNTFDMVTAYSFLDHVYDIGDVVKEVYRVLKPGGIFYADLNPNQAFWKYIGKLIAETKDPSKLSEPVLREYNAIKEGDTLSNKIGLSKEVMEISEPGKAADKGFDKETLEKQFKKLGFSEVKVTPDWFVGQGQLIHQYSESDVKTVEDFLLRTYPLSAHYFKYLTIELKK